MPLSSPLARTRARHRFLGGVAATSLIAATMITAPLAPASAIDEAIHIEGESPTSTNMPPGAASQAGASGGSSLRLYTTTAAPEGGYVAGYAIETDAAGVFQLDATTIPVGVGWASPYRYRINGGAWQSTSGAQQTAVVSSELRSYRLGTVGLVAGSNTFEVQVTQRRAEPNTNYTAFFDAFTVTPVPLVLRSVTTAAPFGVIEHGDPAELAIALNAAAPAPTAVEWAVIDYHGVGVASGATTVPAGSTTATADLGTGLPTGAYRATATLGGASVSGSLAVLPALQDRIPTDDSPFASDVYGSKLIAAEDAADFARVLELTGVDWIRDRQRWNDQINPAPGTFDFSSQGQPLAWLQAADAAGLKTLSSFHDGPTWTHTTTRELPQDLRDMYAFTLAAGEEYDGLVDAWQLWNEQNRGFALDAEGADRYASAMKAASLGFLDSGTDALLVSGGLAGVDPHYADAQFRNGILDYVDAYAYHTHTTANSTATVTHLPGFASQIAAAAPFETQRKGRWVTESGAALQTVDINTPPDATQENVQARFVVTSAAQSLARGTSKHFFFIAAPYREGVNYWSMYRSPGEPMAAVAAQSVLTWQLGEGHYTGRLSPLPPGAEGYAFGTGRGATAVLWSADDSEATVGFTGPSVAAVDIMGNPVALAVQNGQATVRLGPDPVYVSADALTGVVDAPSAVDEAPRVTASSLTEADRVIVQQRYSDAASATSQTTGYALSPNTPNPLAVEVYNFNDHEVTAQIAVSAEGGWTASTPITPVTIPPGGRTVVDLTVSAGSELSQSSSNLTATATVGGRACSPSVAEVRPVKPELTASHVVAGADDVMRLEYTNHTAATRTVSEVEWTFDSDPATAVTANVSVAPGAATALLSPPAPAGAGQTAYEAVVHFAGGGAARFRGEISALSRRDVPHLRKQGIAVDGVLDDLTGAASVIPTAPGITAPDHAAEAWFTWDDEALYLSAQVIDDQHTQPNTGNATWRADGIQVAIAPQWPGETDLRPEVQPRVEFGVALTPSGAQLYRFASGGVGGFPLDAPSAAVSRDEVTDKVVYEAAIPWSLLDPIGARPDKALSLSIAVNDADGGMTRSWLEWGEGVTTSKDTELFRPVILDSDARTNVPGGAHAGWRTVRR